MTRRPEGIGRGGISRIIVPLARDAGHRRLAPDARRGARSVIRGRNAGALESTGRETIAGAGRRRTNVSTLKEFLAAEAEKLRGEQEEALNKRAEWIASIERLFAQIKDWLEQADAERILVIDESPIRISEQGLGTYEAPALTIGLGTREVRIKPIARDVSAPLRVTSLLQGPGPMGAWT